MSWVLEIMICVAIVVGIIAMFIVLAYIVDAIEGKD